MGKITSKHDMCKVGELAQYIQDRAVLIRELIGVMVLCFGKDIYLQTRQNAFPTLGEGNGRRHDIPLEHWKVALLLVI